MKDEKKKKKKGLKITLIVISSIIALIVLINVIITMADNSAFANKMYNKCFDKSAKNVSTNSMFSDADKVVKSCNTIKSNAFWNREKYNICVDDERDKAGNTEQSLIEYAYGGWMYCTVCNKNIGYLCYVTYDELCFKYECNCGSKGSILLNFVDSDPEKNSDRELIPIKNRLCCSEDEFPLITVLSKNIKNYEFQITCKECGNQYKKN